MNNQAPEAHCPASPAWRSAVVIALLLAMTACSSGDPASEPGKAEPKSKASTSESPAGALPEGFPEQIPLPRDYIVVRDSSRTTEETGREISLNIALPGSLEEWTPTYQSALKDAFQAVEFRESNDSLQWRFHGHGFEYAVLYLNDNQGYLDRGAIDSSHLPVMMTLNMMEQRPGQ